MINSRVSTFVLGAMGLDSFTPGAFVLGILTPGGRRNGVEHAG